MIREGKLLLRKPEEKDLKHLSQLASNKKIWDNLRDYMPFPYTEKDAKTFLEKCREENPSLTFGIEYDELFCGVIGINLQPDVYKKSGEIGYWIGEPFWNKGIASRALKLMTAYGLNELKFERLHTGVYEYNTASMRVLEKNRYQKEGIARKLVFKNGSLWDEHRYAVLRSEWSTV